MLKGEVIAAFLILARLDEVWAPSTHHQHPGGHRERLNRGLSEIHR